MECICIYNIYVQCNYTSFQGLATFAHMPGSQHLQN